MRQRKWIPGTPEHRAHMAEYMRGYRVGLRGTPKESKPNPAAAATKPCHECGHPIPPERFYYCSKKCLGSAANRRLRSKNRARYVEYSRKFRRERLEDARQSARNWRAKNPDYYKNQCACGRLKNKDARRCDVCRLSHEAWCKNNPACEIGYTHKHCRLCGEPMRRRWDEMCPICESERKHLGMSVDEFVRAAKKADDDGEIAA